MISNDPFTLPINVDPNVTPDAPEHVQPTIGLIGMGLMGRMYVKFLSQAGWKKCVFSSSLLEIDDMLTYSVGVRIYVCDLPEKYEQLKADYAGTF